MTTYFKDTDYTLTDTERALRNGFPNSPSIEKLYARISSAILTKNIPDSSARAVLLEASAREPGVVLRQFFDDDVLDVTVKDRRPILDVDKRLSPYYGYVRDGLREAYRLGLEPSYGEYWLDYFLKDSAVYRVNIIACLCTAAGLLRAGGITRLGTPTQLAKSSRPAPIAPDPDPDNTDLAVFFNLKGTVDVTLDYTNVSLHNI